MIHALNQCDYLAQRLGELKGTTLHLHSLFDGAANYRTADDHLFTLLTRDKSLAVASARLPVSGLPDLPGIAQELLVTSRGLMNHSLRIELAGAPRVSPRLIHPVLPPLLKATLPTLIREAITSRIPECGIYGELVHCRPLDLPRPDSLPRSDKMIRRLEAFIAALTMDPPGSLTEAVRGIIGYGVGLTPAADDFLLGVLATISRDSVRLRLSTACQANLRRTTAISAEMIYHGSEQRFSQTIVRLLDGSDPQAAISDLLAHGHSSGHDTLCGIYTGLLIDCRFQNDPPFDLNHHENTRLTI